MIKAYAALRAGGKLEPFEYDPGINCLAGDHNLFGSPASIARMLEFAVRHNIKPVVENYRLDQVNEAMQKLCDGDARYRIVLSG